MLSDEAMPDITPTGVARANSNTESLSELMPKIQITTARNNKRGVDNATPTVVPAPQKQFFGVLGQRHVICISGLPNNGKKFLAEELGW